MFWPLIAAASTSYFKDDLDLNLALGLVTSCYGHKTVCWRPACLGEGPSALVTPIKATKLEARFKNKSTFRYF